MALFCGFRIHVRHKILLDGFDINLSRRHAANGLNARPCGGQERKARHFMRQRKAAGTPVHHVSVYAPWVHDDNFLQGVQTLLEAEGFSADRLRLRG